MTLSLDTLDHHWQRAAMRCVALLVGATLLCVMVARPAQAVWMRGEGLYEACATLDNPYSDGFCVGYILGIAEAIRMGFELPVSSDITIRACVSSPLTIGEVTDVVRDWMENNPNYRDTLGLHNVMTALWDEFPCDE